MLLIKNLIPSEWLKIFRMRRVFYRTGHFFSLFFILTITLSSQQNARADGSTLAVNAFDVENSIFQIPALQNQKRGLWDPLHILFPVSQRRVFDRAVRSLEPIEVSIYDFELLKAKLKWGVSENEAGVTSESSTLLDGRVIFPALYYPDGNRTFANFMDLEGRNTLIETWDSGWLKGMMEETAEAYAKAGRKTQNSAHYLERLNIKVIDGNKDPKNQKSVYAQMDEWISSTAKIRGISAAELKLEIETKVLERFKGPAFDAWIQSLSSFASSELTYLVSARGNSTENWVDFLVNRIRPTISRLEKKKIFIQDGSEFYAMLSGPQGFVYGDKPKIAERKGKFLAELYIDLSRTAIREPGNRRVQRGIQDPDILSPGHHLLTYWEDNQSYLESVLNQLRRLVSSRYGYPVKVILRNLGTPTQVRNSEMGVASVIRLDWTLRALDAREVRNGLAYDRIDDGVRYNDLLPTQTKKNPGAKSPAGKSAAEKSAKERLLEAGISPCVEALVQRLGPDVKPRIEFKGRTE